MNEIAYLDYCQESYPTGRKPAKISQEKIRNLKGNYNRNLKTLKMPVESATANSVNSNVVSFPSTPVVPQVTQPTVTQVVTQPVAKNYQNVAKEFNMMVYEKSFDSTDLTGARKIRVSQKTKNEVSGYSNEIGDGKIDNIIPFPKVNTTVNETKPVTNTMSSNMVEFPKVQPSVTSNVTIPSVDDYLQKDKPNQENGVIIQLAGDVETLKEETVKQSALLEQLEAKYNELKTKREQRIKDLEEEKLSYTATLEGLTERIRNLQEAIEKEEQSLSGGYQRAA